jgi:hypothetical protein
MAPFTRNSASSITRGVGVLVDVRVGITVGISVGRVTEGVSVDVADAVAVIVYVDFGVIDDRVAARVAVGDAVGNMVGVGRRTKYSAQDTNDRKIKNITIGTYDRNVLIITPHSFVITL